MYAHHGPNAGGHATKGVGAAAQMSVYPPDANIVHTGHSHDARVLPIQRARINRYCEVSTESAWHVRTPGYKEEWECGEGWAVRRGHPPKPRGAAWIRFFVREKNVKFEVRQTSE